MGCRSPKSLRIFPRAAYGSSWLRKRITFDGRGCHLWDLIMPAFIFMVGMSIPYSVASRRRRGESKLQLFAHAFWRSLVLVLLGIMLHVHGEGNLNFINVLAQIGLGYWAAFLLAKRPVREQV